jgi:hypothetical protein
MLKQVVHIVTKSVTSGLKFSDRGRSCCRLLDHDKEVGTNVTEDPTISIFRAEVRWRKYVFLTFAIITVHGPTTQKITFNLLTQIDSRHYQIF